MFAASPVNRVVPGSGSQYSKGSFSSCIPCAAEAGLLTTGLASCDIDESVVDKSILYGSAYKSQDHLEVADVTLKITRFSRYDE